MLINTITYLNCYNRYQIQKNNGYVSFKSSHSREEDERRLAEQRRLEEERKKKQEEERELAIAKALEAARIAAEKYVAQENYDAKLRQKYAEDKKTIERIIAENRAYDKMVNIIKVQLILEAALSGDEKKVADFKSEFDKDKKEKEVKIVAREAAKTRAEEDLAGARQKKSEYQGPAKTGDARAMAEVFWANAAIQQAEQTLDRCKREESQEAEDNAEIEAISAAIADAEKILAERKKAKTDDLYASGSGTGGGKNITATTYDRNGGAGAAGNAINRTINELSYNALENKHSTIKRIEAGTEAAGTKESAEAKAASEDAESKKKIENAMYERRLEILGDAQSRINKYPEIDNEMSKEVARYLIGFICYTQRSTDHDIGEYFSDEYTAQKLREKLPEECQIKSLQDRKALQKFDELKDPIMMLIAANRMKRFVPNEGVLNKEQQEELLNGIKYAISEAVKNGDMSNFDDDEKGAIKEMVQMIKASTTTNFGISVKLQSLIERLNKKELELSFIPEIDALEFQRISGIKKVL